MGSRLPRTIVLGNQRASLRDCGLPDEQKRLVWGAPEFFRPPGLAKPGLDRGTRIVPSLGDSEIF